MWTKATRLPWLARLGRDDGCWASAVGCHHFQRIARFAAGISFEVGEESGEKDEAAQKGSVNENGPRTRFGPRDLSAPFNGFFGFDGDAAGRTHRALLAVTVRQVEGDVWVKCRGHGREPAQGDKALEWGGSLGQLKLVRVGTWPDPRKPSGCHGRGGTLGAPADRRSVCL